MTKLRSLDKRTRELFAQPNSELLSIFLRSYGLCKSEQKLELRFELIPFFTKIEQNMLRAKKEKDLADSFYRSFLEKQSQYRHSMVEQNQARGKRRFFESKAEKQVDDYILDFDYNQFIVGKQLQVFPFLTDGGFQT